MIKERDRFDKEIRDRGYEPIWVDVEQFLAEDRCLELVGDIDGWLAGDDQITRAVLEKALPRLKVIAKWGTGIDSIDSASAKQLGVPVLNAPGAFADAVAEVAIGLILMVTRHLGRIDREIRTGGWPKPQGLELKNSTLGMIGYGAIGRRIGELGAAFGMNVRFSDPFVDGSESVAEVARAADVLCLACALTPENHHLVNADLLKTMKPGAIVANVARGPLVDTQALVEALQSGHLGGAALDVFEDEPLPADHPLLGFDNVVVSSHNANNGRGAVEAVHARTLSNLDSVIG
ncbi:phosphoglycerate dehydrogenase [Roseovarius indicus]|uniref:phosphoglycerate dehydrogenase n=1 Tax=Roseovarius indicus TaxID=540747 RepID=UPI0032EDBB7B